MKISLIGAGFYKQYWQAKGVQIAQKQLINLIWFS
ncbi:hypothetical protein ABIC84_004558 [Mucilaginibacter sp. 3215]